jgi:hypothetical protein
MDERGGGYEEPIPEPIPEPEQPPIYEEYDMADGKPFDESVMNNNLKGLLDSWKSDEENQAATRQSLQNQLNTMLLGWMNQEHTLVMRTADTNAAQLSRMLGNAATLDALIFAGKMTAQDVTAAKTVEEFRSAAKTAIEAAVAAVPGTAAPAQGSTGTAQAGLQTAGAAAESAMVTQLAVANNAIMAQITKLAEAVGVLTLKVAALEVNPA